MASETLTAPSTTATANVGNVAAVASRYAAADGPSDSTSTVCPASYGVFQACFWLSVSLEGLVDFLTI